MTPVFQVKIELNNYLQIAQTFFKGRAVTRKLQIWQHFNFCSVNVMEVDWSNSANYI
jgi:hypothetical protein